MSGDPRSGNQPMISIMSAGMAMGAEPGAASAEAGLKFIADLNAAGNFVPVAGGTGTIAQGQTPIVAAWDYNLLAWRDSLNGNPPVEVYVPTSGTVAGVYVQAISAFAPHPSAAKLWMEFRYSDAGQLGWLAGYCHPILLPALLGTMALLFASAFGAVATGTALTGSQLSIVPIVLFNQIRGDVLQDPQLGYAIAFGMIVVTAITNFLYLFLRGRSERWTKP